MKLTIMGTVKNEGYLFIGLIILMWVLRFWQWWWSVLLVSW